MSILLSDPGMDNPTLWNFGKVEIKFSKPLDPLSINESFKNFQKPKLEHTFAPEETNKTSIASPIFSALIILVTILYLKYLKSIGINFDNFPKHSTNQMIYSILFIFVIVLYGYFLFLFWVKFNILQTLIVFLITSIPGSVVIFKTISKVEIQI